jgi:hypothetical protein
MYLTQLGLTNRTHRWNSAGLLGPAAGRLRLPQRLLDGIPPIALELQRLWLWAGSGALLCGWRFGFLLHQDCPSNSKRMVNGAPLSCTVLHCVSALHNLTAENLGVLMSSSTSGRHCSPQCGHLYGTCRLSAFTDTRVWHLRHWKSTALMSSNPTTILFSNVISLHHRLPIHQPLPFGLPHC